MKAIIVEDNQKIRQGIISLINSLGKQVDIIGECSNIEQAIIVTKVCKPELIFLDISFKDGNAFDFLERTKEFKYKFIFITAYDKYALKALKIGAVDYILKPVDVVELEEAITKVFQSNITNQREGKKASNKLVISLLDEYQVIDVYSVEFCNSDNGYTTFHLEGKKKIMTSKPLKFFIDKLPISKFVRVHQSYLVNLDYVERYNKRGIVILKGGSEISVSIRKREEFLSQLLNRKR
ncbi:LytR/AlgR family response regulator transcription factor [Tenacibaculum agarivorans]|uniref:LytR/AlgR family response regulator transcription factor n=1 Tax=Tenacibaculum agarivorans TaxID=1908389 RepID=UPI0009F9FA51|nr:LytTR family DNA-binding domain-containing protein [Tenacibaculum agarivorans]